MRFRVLVRSLFVSSAGALLIISVAAFMTRLLPLSMSRYPWNNDSMTECGIALEIMQTGHLEHSPASPWFETHALATPAFDVMLAFVASALGSTPIEIGQISGAVIAVIIMGALFLLGRQFSGDLRGGVVASMMGALMGTFVFTTGSIWKVTPGIAILLLVILAYVNRDSLRYRVLAIVLLFVVPLTHHLVTAIAILLLGYILVWSWFFVITRRAPKRTVFLDTATIGIPVIAALAYYAFVNLDRMEEYSAPVTLALIAAGSIFMSLVAIFVLSLKSHVKMSFAPFIGGGLTVLIFMDFFGLIFPYSPSASDFYILLGLATSLIVGIAWYGSEVMLESDSAYRAVQVSLILAPITIVGYGFVQGFSLASHQVLYRSFDMIDIFLFLGAAVAIVALHRKRKFYALLSSLLIVSLAVSFPFAYYSEPLLGVRHDTQAYEVDSMLWLQAHHGGNMSVLSDERLAYVARSTIWVFKDSSLPQQLAADTPPLWYDWFYIMEDSWTTKGVNNYPNGLQVVEQSDFDRLLQSGNSVYVGGPPDDRLYLFVHSAIGHYAMYDSP